MSGIFHASYPLRFAHCDPAGIGYYPRYLELVDAAVEDWTEAVLGVTRRSMHLDRKLGLPTVDLRAQFIAPSRLGDRLDIAITVRKVGRSSLDLAAEATSEGAPRFRIELTQVLTGLESMTAQSWPDDWRDRLMAAEEQEKEPTA